MCKIIIIPNASKIEKFEDFTRFAAEILSSMRDGYGYAAQGTSGVFGAKSLSPMGYATNSNPPNFCEPITEYFGEQSKVVGAAIFHGRTSTNTINLQNTHPISKDNWYLIHNGVVTHHGEKYDMLTSNDSEHVLHNLMIGGMEGVAKNLTGYYAGGVLDPKGQLHVFRDSIAQLYYAESNKLDSPIFATTIELIEEIGEYIKEELIIYKVKNNTYLIYKNGEIIEDKTFESRGYDIYSKGLMDKSLGFEKSEFPMHEIDDNNSWRFNDDPDLSEEYDLLDDSYTFQFGMKEISCQAFFELDYYDQLECIVSKNGRIVNLINTKIAG